MNIELNQLSNGTPYCIINNFYTEEELSEIIKEVDFLQSRKSIWLDPKDSGSAIDKESNTFLKSNKCIWMNHLYKTESVSSILSYNVKLYTSGAAATLAENHPWFKYLIYNSEFTTLLSYYETDQYYKAHRDQAVLTTLTWIYKEPKEYSGGDLILENDTTINCTNNTMLVMPSTVLHEVTPVELPEGKKGQGLGRYTITTFVKTTTSQS